MRASMIFKRVAVIFVIIAAATCIVTSSYASSESYQEIETLMLNHDWDKLVMIGEPAVEPLIFSLKERGAGSEQSVISALKSMTGKNFGASLTDWLEWWNENKLEFLLKKET